MMFRLTFRGEVSEGGGAVALNLDARRVRERDQHLADAHLKQLGLQVVYLRQPNPVSLEELLDLPLNARTATHAVISL